MDQTLRTALLQTVQDRLRREASPEQAARTRRFFTENPPILGTPSGLTEELGKELAQQVRRAGELADAVWLAG